MRQDYTDYFESNLKLLKQYYPAVWKQVTNKPLEPIGDIFFTSNGKPNLKITNSQGEKIVLHNSENPESEAQNFLKRIPKDHKGFVAILGMGLGYHALSILEERPGLQYLALFELEIGIFIQTLKHIDLSLLLQNPRLILRIGSETGIEEALAPASRTLQLENASVLNHAASFNFKRPEYEKLKNNLFVHLNSLNVGGATTRILGQDFLNNRFKHLCTIQHQLLLEQIKNKFDDIPAILVAGGPSLDKNIHLLKQAQEKAVIIAVDTVLPTLLNHGVHPHFLTCIDPNNLTFEKFADVAPKAKDIALICSSWVNPKTPKIFPASQTFWTFTAKPMEAWISSLIGGNLLTGGASTVAHLNLIAANILGCDPIIFIGQDLAYPQSVTHASGTVLQGSSPTGIIVNNTEGETVKGIDGTILRTNRSFLSMKTHFEAFISNSSKTYINATEGGAHIDGTQVTSLQRVVDKYCKTQIDTSRRLKKYYISTPAINPEKLLTAFDKMFIKTGQLQKDIKAADAITKSMLNELAKLKRKKSHLKSFNMLSPQHQKQINKIDHYHKNLDAALDIWKILEEITMEGLKESERQRQEITIFANDPAKYSQWLIKNLERLMGINKIRRKTLQSLATNLDMVTTFHKKENACLKKISAGIQKEQNRLNLARLYMESKNYFLARPIVETLLQSMPESAELHFYQGCIAEQFSLHKNATEHFNTAIKYNPEFVREIDAFRQDLGNEFMGFVRYFKTQTGRAASIKYMILKGLRHCPGHNELNTELRSILDRDLETIQSNIATNHLEEADTLVKEWEKNLTDQETSGAGLPTEPVSAIFLNKGRLHLKNKDYARAIENFKKALSYSPHNPDLHFITIDTFFVAQDFNGAIEALNEAIKTDNSFAAYWETIGDSLNEGNQYEDAIFAYEKCFMYLPDNINLLKKIGDCYLATNQLEAAKTAFEQLKLKMKTRDAPGTDKH